MTANALFGCNNQVEAGALSASSEAPGLDVGQLQVPQGSTATAWQTAAGVTAAAVVIDAGSVVDWRAFLLARTNLSGGATVRWRVGEAASIAEATAALALDFIQAVPSSMAAWSATRGGAGTGEATYFNAAGSLVIAGGSEWRITHDPATLRRLGLLIEPARTNSIRNPRCAGAVAGTPGTLPTNFLMALGAGLTREVIGGGTENGLPYVDVRVTGTAIGGGASYIAFYPEANNVAAALTGQTWTYSHFHRLAALVAGAPTAAVMFLAELTSGGALVRSASQSVTVPGTAGRLSALRPSFTMPLSGGATTAFLQAVTTYYFNAGAVDVTIRYALPQLEQGEFATSPILPASGSPAATTRAVDGGTLTTAVAGQGTLYVEDEAAACTAGAVTAGQVRLRNAAATNSLSVRGLGGATPARGALAVASSTTVATSSNSPITPGATHRLAAAYASDDFSFAAQGASLGTDSSGILGAMDRLEIAGGERLSCYRAIRIYATRLTDAQLLALSGSGSTLTPTTYDSGLLAAGVRSGIGQTVHVAPAAVSGRCCRCDISDPGNADGLLSIGLAYAGPVWQPGRNIDWGSAFGVDPMVDDVTTRGGQEYPSLRWERRRWDVAHTAVADAEIWPSLMEFWRIARRGDNVLFIPDPASGDLAAEAVFGRAVALADLTYPLKSRQYRAWRVRITERL